MENLKKDTATSNNENGNSLIFVVLMMTGFGSASLNGFNRRVESLFTIKD